ncbi:MAG: S-layer homology domain-containing protein [Bacillota bacterium]
MKLKPKTVFMLIITLVLILAQLTPVFAYFPDTGGHWAEDDIRAAYEERIALGYPDKSFRPDDAAKRSEFCAFFNRAFGFRKVSAVSFPDVPVSEWYHRIANIAVTAGYISPNEDGSFRPDGEVSRKQAAAIAAGILKLDLSADISYVSAVEDVQKLSDAEKGAIGALLRNRLMELDEKGFFEPERPITRAETIILLRGLLKAKYTSKASIYYLHFGTDTLSIRLTKNVPDLRTEDYVLEAQLDNEKYEFADLEFDAERNNFKFKPIQRKELPQSLVITVSAAVNSTKIKGSKTIYVTIPPLPIITREDSSVEETEDYASNYTELDPTPIPTPVPTPEPTPEPSIAYIDSIDEFIYVGDEYSLPDTVYAVMSDESSREVEVVWDPSEADSSEPGVFTFTGNVEGYEGDVILTLTVMEYEEGTASVSGYALYEDQIAQNGIIVKVEIGDGVLAAETETNGHFTINDIPVYGEGSTYTITAYAADEEMGYEPASVVITLTAGEILHLDEFMILRRSSDITGEVNEITE